VAVRPAHLRGFAGGLVCARRTFKNALNDARKHVPSSNPAASLDWPNSTLLHGDVPAAVAELRQRTNANLVIAVYRAA